MSVMGSQSIKDQEGDISEQQHRLEATMKEKDEQNDAIVALEKQRDDIDKKIDECRENISSLEITVEQAQVSATRYRNSYGMSIWVDWSIGCFVDNTVIGARAHLHAHMCVIRQLFDRRCRHPLPMRGNPYGSAARPMTSIMSNIRLLMPNTNRSE